MKVLSRQYSSNPQIVSRFIAEARAVNQIRHKQHHRHLLVRGTLPDGRQYYVMELLEGMTLDKLIHERRGVPIERRCPSCALSRAPSTRPTRRASRTAI
jgi:serine/threonine protein kinase